MMTEVLTPEEQAELQEGRADPGVQEQASKIIVDLREQLREAKPALLRAVRRLDDAAHDVEGNLGCDASDLLFTDEEIEGYRSAYRDDSNTLRALAEKGESDET